MADTGLLLQYLVIAVAVVASAAYVVRSRFPATLRRIRVALAVPLVREGRPAWMRGLGRRLAPAVATGAGSCGSCDGCG